MKKYQDLADIFVYSLAIPDSVVVLESNYKKVLDINLLKKYIQRKILLKITQIEDLLVNCIIFIQVTYFMYKYIFCFNKFKLNYRNFYNNRYCLKNL